MTKEIFIKITGSQALDGDVGTVETSASGEYYKKDGKHYIVFAEAAEGFSGTVKNLIRLEEGRMEITKRGSVAVKMIFERDKKFKSVYQTPYGGFPIEIETKMFTLRETETRIGVMADYVLKADQGRLADCRIRLEVRAKKG